MWSHVPFLQWHPLHLIYFKTAISHLRLNISCTLVERKGCSVLWKRPTIPLMYLHESCFLKTTLHFRQWDFQIGLTSKKYEELKILFLKGKLWSNSHWMIEKSTLSCPLPMIFSGAISDFCTAATWWVGEVTWLSIVWMTSILHRNWSFSN